MLPSKKKKKRGFILLEAVVFITLMMVLGAAMLSASYNDRVRSLEYSTNNQAYNAALSALQLLVDGESTRLLNGQDLQYLTNSPAESPLSTQIAITTSEDITVTIPVDIAIASAENNSFTLTATANVGTQSETVQMVVQYHDADTIPSLLYGIEQSNSNTVLYGSGLAGKLTASNGSNTFRLNLGADTDLYLFDSSNSDSLTLSDSSIGGNVLITNQILTVKNSTIGGMLLSNSNLIMENSVLGNQAVSLTGNNQTVKRLSGIYTPQTLTLLPGNSIEGDVYSNILDYKGGCLFSETSSVYFTERNWGTLVYGNSQNSTYSLADGYRRGDSYGYASSPNFKNFTESFVNLSALPVRMYTPTLPNTMTIFSDGAVPENNVGLSATISRNFATITSAPPCIVDGTAKVGTVIFMQDDATLSLRGQGPFYLMVYGNGTNNTVQVDSGAQIYGCLQNVTVEIQSGSDTTPELNLSYIEPIPLNNASLLDAPASNGKTTPYFQLISIERLVPQSTSES